MPLSRKPASRREAGEKLSLWRQIKILTAPTTLQVVRRIAGSSLPCVPIRTGELDGMRTIILRLLCIGIAYLACSPHRRQPCQTNPIHHQAKMSYELQFSDGTSPP